MLRVRDVFIVLAVLAAGSLAVQACGSKSNGFTGGDSGFTPVDAAPDKTAPTDGSTADVSPGDDAGCIVCGEGGASSSGGQPSPIPTTCADALSRNSYIGCDYWPTVTLNPVWPEFDYAVAVSNPQSTAVTVTVTGGGLTSPLTVNVPALEVQAIPLPWVAALKGPTYDENTAVSDPGQSRILTGGAYHLTTSLPVSVYQFSALEYEIDAGTTTPDGGTCPGEGDSGAGSHCYSYSNDASLLLPSNVATGDYGVLAWPSFAATPGFLAVVATADGTTVTVNPAGRVQGVPGVGPALMVRGDSYTYTLAHAGDVLEMFSDTGDIHTPVYTQDLSGTIVQANHPIVTYGGHGCTFIPENKKACDHLESSMFPVQSLGTDYIVTMPSTPHGEHEWVRTSRRSTTTRSSRSTRPSAAPTAASSASGTCWTCRTCRCPSPSTPTAASSSPTTSSASSAPCRTTRASRRRTSGTRASARPSPSRSTARPTRSSRRAPTRRTGSTSWPRRRTASSATVVLDGTTLPASDFKNTVGSQPFAIAHELLPPGQEGHSITSTSTFGLYVYGYGSRTSYMYPGGLDLRIQNVPPPPAQ